MVNRGKAGEMVDGDRKLTVEFHRRDVTEDVDRRGRILTGVV